MPAKRLTTSDVTFFVTPHEAYESPRGSYAVPGIIDGNSPEADEFVAAVEEMIDKHGLWGWCDVKVTARLNGLQGEAHLGGCSYKDADDFKEGGYYPQMCEEALAELQREVDDLYPLIHVEASDVA